MPLITLNEWGQRLPVPRSQETLRRWNRAGKIYPAPTFDGYQYLVEENAVKINPAKPGCLPSSPVTGSLTSRIKHGRTEKKP
ncbi:excisionase [Erwinia sp.]|uniref:excisionase n=1 Tax=Erwinia citreus TaxID=558 RepID=UPI003C72894E